MGECFKIHVDMHTQPGAQATDESWFRERSARETTL
jgi:hypothetical protein